jgi:hypothetical protein
MIWLVISAFLFVMVSFMIVTLFSSAKGEDKLRESSYKHYHG